MVKKIKIKTHIFVLGNTCSKVEKFILCHPYRLSPSNQVSHTIFDNPISLKRREEKHKCLVSYQKTLFFPNIEKSPSFLLYLGPF